LELRTRIIPDMRDRIRSLCKVHDSLDCADLDEVRWKKVRALRKVMVQDTTERISLVTQFQEALDAEDYDKASELQVLTRKSLTELESLYYTYKRNIL